MSYELRILRRAINSDEVLICPLPTEDILQYRTNAMLVLDHPTGDYWGPTHFGWSEWKDVPIVEEGDDAVGHYEGENITSALKSWGDEPFIGVASYSAATTGSPKEPLLSDGSVGIPGPSPRPAKESDLRDDKTKLEKQIANLRHKIKSVWRNL